MTVVTKRRILVIDDDAALRQSLSEQLRLREEFEILEAGTGLQGLETIKSNHVDLVLLDVGLPDLDGREVCRLMRRAGFKAPIVMLTAARGEADTILGLDSGANDYIAKPFRINVLLARIHAHLRQYDNSEDAVFAIGPYTFYPAKKMLVDEATNRKIRLTHKEAAILKFLYRMENKVVGRDVLLNEVWGYTPGVTTHTVETHIYRLRHKIERDPANAELLVTEASGYRLAR